MLYQYKKNKLYFGEGTGKHNLLSIAKKQGTPIYVYDLKSLRKRLSFFQKHISPAHLHYAMKANSHPDILKIFVEESAGVDVVSGGEIKLALKAGFKGQDIVFSGVGKTKEEIELGLKSRILQFNVESVSELKRVAQISRQKNKKAPVAFRLNPEVNIESHPYIRTGLGQHKFGLQVEQIPLLKEVLKKHPSHLELKGLTIHIGSQIQELRALKSAILKLKSLYKDLQKEYDLKTFDVGGGLGVDYKSYDLNKDLRMIKEYGAFLKQVSKGLKTRILTEPGRILIARFACLIGEVQYLKSHAHKNFVILNTGMHHFMRPALYQAWHNIWPLQKRAGETKMYDVAGPVCESADIIGRERVFSGLREGDFMAILDTGAYGAVLMNHYNAFPPAREIGLL